MTLVQQDTATAEECAAALRQLTDADLQRLEQLARVRVIGLEKLVWGDLLNEAVTRVLDGSRHWPRGVSLVVFLRETMRSIASDHWRRVGERVVVAESEMIRADRETGHGAVDIALDASMEPEARVSAAETLARIEALFEGDAEALQVMAGMACGKSPDEIQKEICINATRYASTQRRIRRRLVKEFHEEEI